MPEKLRLRFSKTGRAIYLSHLDLMRTMQRAFLRAGYQLKYSEGFNPHPLISILLPLSVGTASICELMDFRLRGEPDAKLLQSLPASLHALSVTSNARVESSPPEMPITQVDEWVCTILRARAVVCIMNISS